jgi:hypothetical protein
MSQLNKPDATINLGRHQRNCSVCAHDEREEIEAAFVGWRSPAVIAEEYGPADRSSVYRHANALGLFPKRQRNIRAALERIIERADSVDVTAQRGCGGNPGVKGGAKPGQWGGVKVGQ